MNKKIVVLLFATLALSSCGTIKDNTFSGTVVAHGGSPEMFELQTENSNFGFLITENTLFDCSDNVLEMLDIKDSADIDEYFSCDMEISVAAGEKTEAADEYIDGRVENWFVADTIYISDINENYFSVDAKPVIYLYPEEETDVNVSLDYNGEIFCTYPKYTEDGWHVTASPDGKLTDANGIEYNYLYWEGISNTEYDFSEGFCVKGVDIAEFLEDALQKLGLSRREANEFIVYWLPQLESNEYNLISFQSESYTDTAHLSVSPAPDTVIRVFMAWKPLDEPVDIVEQKLESPERIGFTVVEWGGRKV